MIGYKPIFPVDYGLEITAAWLKHQGFDYHI
jgi:hypothetical protein